MASLSQSLYQVSQVKFILSIFYILIWRHQIKIKHTKQARFFKRANSYRSLKILKKIDTKVYLSNCFNGHFSLEDLHIRFLDFFHFLWVISILLKNILHKSKDSSNVVTILHWCCNYKSRMSHCCN